jgi:DNA-binding transcriptional regulator YbjK
MDTGIVFVFSVTAFKMHNNAVRVPTLEGLAKVMMKRLEQTSEQRLQKTREQGAHPQTLGR